MELTRSNRIASIDILRGAIMLIMAIDHSREFFHQQALTGNPLNAATTTLPLYFTRWITHFCAPIFVFLSGVSAWLSSRRKTKKEAGLFLIKRGAWLVLIELTVVTFGITFNPFFNFLVLQVIWAIGWSMIVLGLLSMISHRLVLVIGLLLFFGHNILDYLTVPKTGVSGVLMTILFRAQGQNLRLDSSHAMNAYYTILPWTGAMLLGFSIGHWFGKDFLAARRKQLLLITGTGLIILFIVLRATNWYGNPQPWIQGEGLRYNLLTFLNTSKYPPSLLYLCMTLGPACILLAVLENVRNKLSEIISIYGKVPFFYYILHFYLLHIVCVIVFYATGHTNSQIVQPNQPLFYFRPLNFGYGLTVVYVIWLGVVAALYYPCRWFARYKATHKQWWLSYV